MPPVQDDDGIMLLEKELSARAETICRLKESLSQSQEDAAYLRTVCTGIAADEDFPKRMPLSLTVRCTLS